MQHRMCKLEMCEGEKFFESQQIPCVTSRSGKYLPKSSAFPLLSVDMFFTFMNAFLIKLQASSPVSRLIRHVQCTLRINLSPRFVLFFEQGDWLHGILSLFLY